MTARLYIALALAAAAIAGPAMAAKQIVVRSSGPSAKAYPVGKALDEGAQLSLRAGDSLTVLGPAKARVLKGPGSFKLAAVAETSPYSRRSRFSARRGPPLPRGPWAIDVGQSGTVCVAAKQPLSLWRSSGDSESTVTITGKSGQAVTLNWAAGEQSLRWPDQMPLTDGLAYRVQLAGQTVPSEWTIRTVGSLAMDRSATAEAFLGRGCGAQLDALVERALWEG